jgi:hypothetical protein
MPIGHLFKLNFKVKISSIPKIAILVIFGIAFALAFSTSAIANDANLATSATCDIHRTLAVGAVLKQSDSWSTMSTDWISFNVQKDAHYLLQVSNAEELQLEVFERCDSSAPAVALQNGQLDFTATHGGEYYLLIRQNKISIASSTGYQVTLSLAAPPRPSVAATQDIPTEVLRRATEFLEMLRGSDMAPEWKDARINPEVGILYRPDIQGPAYYECRVEAPSASGYVPAGYILLASGEHDYLIVNWNSTGLSTSQELEELAPLGAQLTEIYRLNTMSYVAEYEEFTALGITILSNDVVTLGELPDRIEGLASLPEEPFELVTQGIDSDGNESYTGPTELPLLTESPWDSWQALKDGYAEDYAPLLKSLKERASDEWTLEENLNKYGETLVKGNIRTIYGLATQTLSSIQVTGEGAAAQYLGQQEMKDGDTLIGIILTVLAEPSDPKTLLPIQVGLQYTSGATETLKYAIANHTALHMPYRISIPLVINGSQGTSTTAVESADTSSWGPWHYYWVDSSSDALAERYDQIWGGSCWSGCGATAWAMEFNWFDRRAAENHYVWKYHWGLYRVNGGLGANAVAPLNQDQGVVNETWEIVGDINTHCSGNQGSTYFTQMINAYKYVQPRATAGWRMTTRYDPTGLCWLGACNGARDLATNQIVNNHAPAIIGANNHYPMAVGYAWQSQTSCFLWWCSTDYNRWFYVNNGWGGSGNGWVDWDDVAFAGIYDKY